MNSLKKIGTKFIALFMVWLLLVSTIGVSLDVHYCQGEVKSIGIFTEADECGMYNEHAQCALSNADQITRIPCCSDTYSFFQNPVVEKQNALYNFAPISTDLVLNLNSFKYDRVSLHIDIQKYYWFKPPPIISDRSILFQNILI